MTRALPLLALLALAGCEPVLALAVDAERAELSALAAAPPDLLLVDVRPRAEHAAGHIPGALGVPFAELDGYLARARARGDRPLLLVGEAGWDAVLAVPAARAAGFTRVRALSGGMSAWRGLGRTPATGTTKLDLPVTIPERPFSRREQALAFLAGGVIKPAYLFLSVLLLVRLRRNRSTPVRLLWHGLLWFFLGEAFCALHFYFHTPGRVHLIDLLHGAGMVAMSALIPWGLFRLLDERVLHFGDPETRCTIQRFCGHCWKREPARCPPHDLMLLLLPALAILSLMPLSAPLRATQFTTTVFGSAADYGVPIVNHLVELRLYPLLGTIVLLAALAPLLAGGPRAVRRAEPLFFTGLGFMTYPLLRHLLVNTYPDALYWSDLWEELTELIMVLALAGIAFVYRRQLGLVRSGAPVAETAGDEG